MAKVTFVTACMGRLTYLQQTLGGLVAQPDSQVVVVDYSCPQQCGHWVAANYPQVRVVRELGRAIYDQARARNLGARGADTPWLFFCDADILLDADFAQTVFPRLEPGRYYRPDALADQGLWGTHLCLRADFELAGGYDEVMQGWGDSDLNLYDALEWIGVKPATFPVALLHHLHHGDEERTRFYHHKDRGVSLAVNRTYRYLKFDAARLTGKLPTLEERQSLYAMVSTKILAAVRSSKDCTLNVLLPEAWDMSIPQKLDRTLTYRFHPTGRNQESGIRNQDSGFRGQESVDALMRQGRWAEAEVGLRAALVLEPGNADLWNGLGTVMERLRRPTEAVIALERALGLRADFPAAQANLQRLRSLPFPCPGGPGADGIVENNRGVELLAERRHAEAEAAFRQALLLAPHLPEIPFNLAKTLQAQQKFPEAEELYRRALHERPDWAEAHFHLGYLHFCQRRLSDAEDAYRRTLALEPGHVEALNSLGGNVLNNQGRIDEARSVYQKALALAPDHASCHSNLVLNEQYAPGATLASLADIHADWERRHAAPLRSSWRTFTQSRDPDRPLRLGFLSADFFYHPVGVFLAPILERLNRRQWFTVCYANQHKNDELTQRLTQAAGQWRWVRDLSDEALAEQIRADRIDLLFDLSGHTGGNRLLTFARKPAPVQLTWMGYVGTTGLAAIDYLLADRFHVPPGSDRHYREKLLRLPDGYLCYEPPPYAPAVGPLPALTSGQFTFGCFNNTAKITSDVVAVWAEILRKVPAARLILKYHWLDDAGLRRRLREQFASAGLASERLELLGSTSHVEQLEQYNRLDLALDTFPYSGGLTTCEACWMGVPVVTCPGETFASRHSFSYLSNIGLTDTIARDRADYVGKAVQLAADLPHLAELRASLRSRMARSPVCDLDRYTEQFRTACRRVWHAWCGSAEPQAARGTP